MLATRIAAVKTIGNKTAESVSAVGELRELVAESLTRVRETCRSSMVITENETILKICDHIMGGRSKLLRPTITLAAALATAENPSSKVKVAACLELIHTATLLHDDVLDGGILRRGEIAVNKLWGGRESILVGDFLLSRAFHLVIEGTETRTLELLANLAAKLVEGEVMQMSAGGNLRLQKRDYIKIVEAKTACLFSVAAELGAGKRYRRALAEYGLNLGIAFQCGDDILDYIGNKSGKTCGQDFAEGKITLPLLLAIRATGDKKFWAEALAEPSSENFRRVVELMRENAVFADARRVGKAYAAKAAKALEPLPGGKAKELLGRVAFDACRREH